MSSGKLIMVEDADFASEVEKSKTPVLVDFGATWCNPCKALGATLDSMVDSYRGQVKFCYVDVQNAPATAQKFGVLSVPTLILFKNGAPAGSLSGSQPKAKIAELISTVL